MADTNDERVREARGATPAREGALTRRIAEHLRSRAARYYPPCFGGAVEVELTGSLTRRMSAVYEYRLSSNGYRRDVIVKVHHLAPDTARRRQAALAGRDAPMLASFIDPDVHPRYEYQAMVAVRRHLAETRNPRFETVEMIDVVPEYRALVMTKAPLRNLHDLYLGLRGGRPAETSPNLDGAFRNAGAWLGHYHAMPPLPHTRVGHTTRDEYIQAVHELADYVGRLSLRRGRYARRAAQVERLARAWLPGRLPTGLNHGDFAPRNILVGTRDQVAGIDTRAARAASIYEDLASFVLALQVNMRGVMGHGWGIDPALTARYEHEFLRGYFGAGVLPIPRIRLFQVILVFDWLAMLSRGMQEARGTRQALKWGRLQVQGRHLERYAWRLLDDAERDAAAHGGTAPAGSVAA